MARSRDTDTLARAAGAIFSLAVLIALAATAEGPAGTPPEPLRDTDQPRETTTPLEPAEQPAPHTRRTQPAESAPSPDAEPSP